MSHDHAPEETHTHGPDCDHDDHDRAKHDGAANFNAGVIGIAQRPDVFEICFGKHPLGLDNTQILELSAFEGYH